MEVSGSVSLMKVSAPGGRLNHGKLGANVSPGTKGTQTGVGQSGTAGAAVNVGGGAAISGGMKISPRPPDPGCAVVVVVASHVSFRLKVGRV